MSSTWVTFLFEVGNFVLLASVLGWLFFRPVRDALERRRKELERDQQIAAETRAAAEQEARAARTRRAELEASLEELRERVQREAEVEREHLIEAARGQIQHERETLKTELAAQRRAETRSLARDAAIAAREIVVQLLKEIDGPDLEHALRSAACRELEALRSSGPLAPVVVETAQPLTDQALAVLAHAAGITKSEASHRVDLELIAGVRVLTARGLVDASAAGLAVQAERVLVSEFEDANHD